MIGLCHFCFSSGVEITSHKGRIFCSNCINPVITIPEIKTTTLLFEDLPQASLEERSLSLARISADTADRIFHKKMNSERVNEVFDKGY